MSWDWMMGSALKRTIVIFMAALLLAGCGGSSQDTPPPGEAHLPTPGAPRAPGMYVYLMGNEAPVVLDQITCSGLDIVNAFLLEASTSAPRDSAGYGEARVNVFHDGYGVYENAEVEILFGPTNEPHLKGRTSIATININENGTGSFLDVSILSTAVNSSFNKEFTVTGEWICP